MARPKRTYSESALRQAVSVSTNWSELHRALGLSISEMGIDTSHFDGGASKRVTPTKIPVPLESLLRTGTNPQSATLRKRLVKEGLLKNECSSCGLAPEWNGKPLSLHLEHINGEHSDNRIENLTILCPNCHSQTDTYGGKKQRKPASLCAECGLPKKKNNGKAHMACRSREPYKTATKIDWPPYEELVALLKATNYSAVGRMLGVSDNAVRKHLRTP